jgi:hypothetical protein
VKIAAFRRFVLLIEITRAQFVLSVSKFAVRAIVTIAQIGEIAAKLGFVQRAVQLTRGLLSHRFLRYTQFAMPRLMLKENKDVGSFAKFFFHVPMDLIRSLRRYPRRYPSKPYLSLISSDLIKLIASFLNPGEYNILGRCSHACRNIYITDIMHAQKFLQGERFQQNRLVVTAVILHRYASFCYLLRIALATEVSDSYVVNYRGLGMARMCSASKFWINCPLCKCQMQSLSVIDKSICLCPNCFQILYNSLTREHKPLKFYLKQFKLHLCQLIEGNGDLTSFVIP